MKIKNLILKFCLIAYIPVFAQNINPYDSFYKKKFGAYLFVQKDYLRSALEFQKAAIEKDEIIDTISFFLSGVSFARINKKDEAVLIFSKITNPKLKDYANSELQILSFKSNPEKFLTTIDNKIFENNSQKKNLANLYLLSAALDFELDFASKIESNKELLGLAHSEVESLLIQRRNLKFKDQVLAMTFSALIPGLGKFYVGEYIDGIISLLGVAGFAILSYENYLKKANIEGSIYAGISIILYSANIVGAYNSAVRYNNQTIINFKSRAKKIAIDNNYFCEDYSFLYE